MSQRNPQDVRTWDYWDTNSGQWRGDASIVVRVASVSNGRSMIFTNGTEVMNDTETEDDLSVQDAESRKSDGSFYIMVNGTKMNANTDTEDTFYLTNEKDSKNIFLLK